MPFCRVPPSGAIRDRAHIWNYYLPPFRMAPHVYQVGGNNDVCVYLLDSGDGSALGGGAVRRRGGGGWVGGWGRCLANYNLDFTTILIFQSY